MIGISVVPSKNKSTSKIFLYVSNGFSTDVLVQACVYASEKDGNNRQSAIHFCTVHSMYIWQYRCGVISYVNFLAGKHNFPPYFNY